MSINSFPPQRPVVLVVLDGWGHRSEPEGNAIALGRTPTWDSIWTRAPKSLLQASGRAVGLPEGQMGNSEVGHLNLGAGRSVPQDIVRISDSIHSGEFFQIPSLKNLCTGVRSRDTTLHILGLIGPGGVHAVHGHLLGALQLARRQSVPRVAIHCFLDGRDTPPRSAGEYMREVQRAASEHSDSSTHCFVATAAGRYYAMDRDRRWDRTKLAYDALVRGAGQQIEDPAAAIKQAYGRGESDEFLKPMVMVHDGRPAAPISDGDGVFCINFRADRMRQIVRTIAIEGFAEFETGERPNVEVVTMIQYDVTFPIPAAFEPATLSRIVAESIANSELRQFHTAETEKYAHVTYFFNGGIEVPYKGEERILVDSPKVATYDLQPEMSARGVTDVLCRALEAKEHHFYLCNYANADMVGHTGMLDKAITAVETVDECLARILQSAERSDVIAMITADHGNCEIMIDPETGGPHTAHTTSKVPFVVVGDDRVRSLRPAGSLRDVGPTVLDYLGVELPVEMTGKDLRNGVNE